MAWIGIRPVATSWPPDRRAAAANGAAQQFSQTSTPDGPGLHGRREMLDVFFGEDRGETGLDRSQIVERVEIVDLHRFDGAGILAQDQDVEDADRAGVDERSERRGHLAGEVARTRGNSTTR